MERLAERIGGVREFHRILPDVFRHSVGGASSLINWLRLHGLRMNFSRASAIQLPGRLIGTHASHHKAHAFSLHLLFDYIGSNVFGMAAVLDPIFIFALIAGGFCFRTVYNFCERKKQRGAVRCIPFHSLSFIAIGFEKFR